MATITGTPRDDTGRALLAGGAYTAVFRSNIPERVGITVNGDTRVRTDIPLSVTSAGTYTLGDLPDDYPNLQGRVTVRRGHDGPVVYDSTWFDITTGTIDVDEAPKSAEPVAIVTTQAVLDQIEAARVAAIEDINAAGGGTGSTPHIRVARKTVDTIRNNTAARTNDPGLVIPVDPGTYVLDALLLYNGTASADMRVEITVPAGSTLAWSPNSPHASVTGVAANSINRAVVAAGAAVFGAVGADVSAMPSGIVTVTTPGDIAISWAQSVAEVADLTMRAGSYLRLTPVPDP